MDNFNIKKEKEFGVYYYLYNKLHRINGPAIEYSNGSLEWWVNGLRHNLNGPAIERSNGDKYWYVNGKLHRTDGPAIEWKDCKKWLFDGKLIPVNNQKEFENYILKNNLVENIFNLKIEKQLVLVKKNNYISILLDKQNIGFYNNDIGLKINIYINEIQKNNLINQCKNLLL